MSRRIDGVRTIGEHDVCGLAVDPSTRCRHYDEAHDVVAIALPCCVRADREQRLPATDASPTAPVASRDEPTSEVFFPCYRCHDACTAHERKRWPSDRFDEHAVLCGACGGTMAIETYLDVQACPDCGHPFNPGCADHYELYFETD